MYSSKKAIDLSLNTIVIAVLVLLVLVVIAIIFSGSVAKFVKGTEDCASLGGRCGPAAAGCTTLNPPAKPECMMTRLSSGKCTISGDVCWKVVYEPGN